MNKIGCLDPSIQPKATEHIEQMIKLINNLIDKKHAYVAQNHVLFDVNSFKDYGKLAKGKKKI